MNFNNLDKMLEEYSNVMNDLNKSHLFEDEAAELGFKVIYDSHYKRYELQHEKISIGQRFIEQIISLNNSNLELGIQQFIQKINLRRINELNFNDLVESDKKFLEEDMDKTFRNINNIKKYFGDEKFEKLIKLGSKLYNISDDFKYHTFDLNFTKFFCTDQELK